MKKGDIDLDSFGVPARSVQISYADSMDVSVHVVHVSRLHGVAPPEPYLRADGGRTPEPQEVAKPKPLAKVQAKKANGSSQGGTPAQTAVQKADPGPPHPVQEELEGHLQTLWKARWISKDPGDPGSVNDPESQAAIRDYQEKFMKGAVPQLGHADPNTRARIAKAAASAAAMPMVNAALQLAHERGEIQSAPGSDPAQLDDATRAAVKEFQTKKGLDADGIPGPLTQGKLSAYMKEAAKARPAPAQEANAGEQPAKVLLFYFTRNHGPAGKPVTLKLATTPACNGKTFSVSLFKDGEELVKGAGRITVSAGQGTADLIVPEDVAPGSALTARLSEGELRAETSAPFSVVGTGAPPATLTILAADGTAGHDPGKLRLGAGSGLQLKWSVTGATKATLTARPLVENACEASEKPSGAERVSNDQLVSSGIDLPLDSQGSGSGAVPVDPGPCGSTEYTVSVTRKSGEPVMAKATAFVANFNAQIELPDGSDYARNKPCVLEIPGQEPVQGTTNQCGELWLWLPNTAAETATLRLLDGGSELARWTVEIHADEGVPAGAPAQNDEHAAAGASA